MVKFHSNKREVKARMKRANRNMLEAVGKAGKEHVRDITPVGVYPRGSGRVGGALLGSINYKATEKDVYVGSTPMSEMYPIYVHEGTYKMAAQPYIKDGIMKNLGNLRTVAQRNYKL